MKKIIILTALFASSYMSAQNYKDALRYSQEDFVGTARYRAMSGAFGALGGDISAITLNPAGSAVFSSSEISISFGEDSYKKENSLSGRLANTRDSDFTVSQFGLVFSFPNTDKNSLWKKFNLAFSYNRAKNFDLANLTYYGASNVGLDNYFHNFAVAGNLNNTAFPLGTFPDNNTQNQGEIGEFYKYLGENYGENAQNAYLGIKTQLVVPNSDNANETGYVANANNSQREQKYEVETKGNVNKYNFNFGTQYGDNLYLGASVNSYAVDAYALYSLREDSFDNSSLVRYANHQVTINTTGSGVSFQLGAIAKATDNLRLGLTYQSPTWYSVEEETRQVLYAEIKNKQTGLTEGSDVELINRYGDPISYLREYKFRSPGSWTASAAYVFGKNAILSLDYIYRGYGNTYFRTGYLKPENDIIQNELGDTSSIRIGGEYRIKAFSLRAGYRYEQSPYKNTKFIGDLNGYSFGIGYGFGGIRLDVSYDVAKQTNQYQMYERVITTPVKTDTVRDNLIFTASLKL